MINDLYKNIINSFITQPTLEPKKQAKNKEIKGLEKHVRILLNPKTNKNSKKKIIKILKNKIQEIDKQYHLRISKLINLGRINTEELDFALEIICDTPKIQDLFKQINEYKEISFELSSYQSDIVNKQNIKNEINNLIKQIKNIQNTNYTKNPIKQIAERIRRKKQLDNIKNKIWHIISKTTGNTQEQDALKEILNKKPLDVEKFENVINEQLNEQIQSLEEKQLEVKNRQIKNRSIIPIKQDKFSRITSFQKDDYLTALAQTSFIKNSEKKNEFISKIIFILKLIDLVEKNDTIAINELTRLMQNRIELENANQTVEEKHIERKR